MPTTRAATDWCSNPTAIAGTESASGGLDYLLKRSDIDVDASGKAGHPA